MAAKIIDGKQIAAEIRAELAKEIEGLKKEGLNPGLAVILVGDDPASRVYVNNKKKACAEVGIYSREYALPKETTQEELLNLIRELNQDPEIHGILVQLPLPDHLDERQVLETISPAKDVDGFHPVNVGRLVTGQPCQPCTPRGSSSSLTGRDRLKGESRRCRQEQHLGDPPSFSSPAMRR